MAICRVSEKSRPLMYAQYTARLDFFATLHLTIFERSANFEFFSQLGVISD
ncbi:hypothetical protein SAMN04488082_11761 [Desulfomicrobium apsheronum]|uniref:Uncharacterized protein n=1 Tax=Desulfomicrobium apsheronum TaxID=52560 RepID=A0A1I3XS93_9BACT|nr:hypothetical protein [Desulfomicrobium apsheronum]SFK22415.1 hypothetical protein SAMN04488082_11761 [Desulfomicrobium apsheronum]